MKTKFAILIGFLLATAWAQEFRETPELDRALAGISADSLRGNLSFLASDLLEGRDTPSRGLDIAAEYIAAQFRRLRLEPVGDDGYFQTARMLRTLPPPKGFEMRFLAGPRSLAVSGDDVTVLSEKALDLAGLPVYRTAGPEVRGKIVLLDATRADLQMFLKIAAANHPAAFLEAEDEDGQPAVRRLIDPDEERAIYGGVPRVIVRDKEAVRMLGGARDDNTGVTITMKLPRPEPAFVTVRNVAGLLRGSDAALRNQYVLLTAHYDHIGRSASGEIRPGANDDASGVVSVIEIAQALAGLTVRPKRSILFMVFFGEEEGSLGSRYYVRHPLFPISKTVADLNLEQMGRTDSDAGPEVSNATATGFQYSSVIRTLQRAGELTGIKVYETPNSDRFYSRSDNLPFAEHGIPAHTLAVTFEFPDYHEPGDVWGKIDYGNMAKVDRMVALGVVMLADGREAPRWNSENPGAAQYEGAR